MPKRFADSTLLEKSWFLDLSYESKMIWFFLERSCDHAGIWEIDIPRMRRCLGSKQLQLDTFLDEVNRDYSKTSGEPEIVNRVMLICNNSKLWMTGFISDQYEKSLNGINISIPAIKSVVNRLKDEGIYEFAIKEGFVRIQKQKIDNSIGAEISAAVDIRDADIHQGELLPISAAGNLTMDSLTDIVINNEDNLIKKEKASIECNLFPINIPAAKGSEPLERDKDKDKDKVKDSSSGSNINLKDKGGAGGETNSAVVKELFTTHWGKKPYTPHEESFATKLINDYGTAEVRFAFGEAVNHNRLNLAYIKGILQKRRNLQEKEKAEQAQRAERIRLANKANEERQQGIKLNLIESVYGQVQNNTCIK